MAGDRHMPWAAVAGATGAATLLTAMLERQSTSGRVAGIAGVVPEIATAALTALVVTLLPTLGRRRLVVGAVVGWWIVAVVAVLARAEKPPIDQLLSSFATFGSIGTPLPDLRAGTPVAAVLLVGILTSLRADRSTTRLRVAIAGGAVTLGILARLMGDGASPATHLVEAGVGLFAVAVVGGPPTPWSTRTRALTAVALAAGSGSGGWLTLVAGQYRERVVFDGPSPLLPGPIIAPVVWVGLCVTATSVLVAVAWTVMADPRRFRTGAEDRLLLGAIACTGFFVRLAALFHIAPRKTDLGDPLFYHTTANLFARGRGFHEPLRWISAGTVRPSALHGPLYPLVLSIASRLGGTSYFDHKMTSIVIGTATVASIGVLARLVASRSSHAAAIGFAAAGLAAVYPSLWLVDGLLFPEGLAALTVTWVLILALRWREAPSPARLGILGAVLGLATLTRGESALLGPLLVVPLVLLVPGRSILLRLRDVALAGAACVAVIAPWAARNASVFEHFVPLSTNANEMLVYSNCDTAYSGELVGFWDFGCQERIRAVGGGPDEETLDESQTSLIWRDIGLDYARDNLGEIPRVVTVRILRQWELYRPIHNTELGAIEGRDQTASRWALAQYYAMAGFAIAGAVRLRRHRRTWWPLVIPAVIVTVTAAATYGTVRFRATAEPSLIVLAAVGSVPFVGRARRWFIRPHPPDDVVDGAAWLVGGRGGMRVRRHGSWHTAALRTWAGLAAIMATVAVALPGLYRATGGSMEEGFMLVFPERLLAGDLPNRDFLHLYGPASIHVLALWYRLVGVTLEAERTFGLLQHLALLAGIFVVARPWGRLVATATTLLAVFYVLNPVVLTAMAWNGAVALGLWSVLFAVRAEHVRRPGVHRLIAGLLGGLALAYRPDIVVALALVHIWLLVRRRPDGPRLWPAAGRLSAGLAIGLLPMWVHLAMVGIGPAVEGMLIDPVVRLRPGRELPRPPSWDRLDGALQAVAELTPPWWGLPHLRAERSLFVWFFVMLLTPVALLAVARWSRRRGTTTRPDLLTAGALFGLGLLPQGLQRPDSTHLAWVTCVSIPLLVVAIAEVILVRRPSVGARQRAVVALAVVTSLTLIVAPLFTFRTWLLHVRVGVGQVHGPFPVERDGRRFYLGDYRAYRDMQMAVEDLARWSAAGESLIVGPSDLRRTWYSDAFVYYLFPELEPGTVFIEMDPGIADASGSPLAEELRRTDWVLLTGLWDGWYEPNTSVEFGNPEPMLVVAEEFCLAREYPNELVRLYRRCTP